MSRPYEDELGLDRLFEAGNQVVVFGEVHNNPHVRNGLLEWILNRDIAWVGFEDPERFGDVMSDAAAVRLGRDAADAARRLQRASGFVASIARSNRQVVGIDPVGTLMPLTRELLRDENKRQQFNQSRELGMADAITSLARRNPNARGVVFTGRQHAGSATLKEGLERGRVTSSAYVLSSSSDAAPRAQGTFLYQLAKMDLLRRSFVETNGSRGLVRGGYAGVVHLDTGEPLSTRAVRACHWMHTTALSGRLDEENRARIERGFEEASAADRRAIAHHLRMIDPDPRLATQMLRVAHRLDDKFATLDLAQIEMAAGDVRQAHKHFAKAREGGIPGAAVLEANSRSLFDATRRQPRGIMDRIRPEARPRLQRDRNGPQRPSPGGRGMD